MRTIKSTDQSQFLATPTPTPTTQKSNGSAINKGLAIGVGVLACAAPAAARNLNQVTVINCSNAILAAFEQPLANVGAGCTIPYTAVSNGVCTGTLSALECSTLTHNAANNGRGDYAAYRQQCPTFPASAAYPAECGIASGTYAASGFNVQNPATYNAAANDWVSTRATGQQKGCNTYNYNGNNCQPLDGPSCDRARDVRSQLDAVNAPHSATLPVGCASVG